jgi:hypothetical protein
LNRGAKHHASNAAKAVDADFDGHVCLLRMAALYETLLHKFNRFFVSFLQAHERAKSTDEKKAPEGA